MAPPWGPYLVGRLAVKKLIVMIDGGHIRVLARKAGQDFNPRFLEAFAHRVVRDGEELHRVLYYDCRPFEGERPKPVSGEPFHFTQSGAWLDELATLDLFAVRLGVLKWRGWKPIQPQARRDLTDADFKPDFEQKGVDLRIGLDIATFSVGRKIDRIALVTGDTDLIPAMKMARREGIQTVGVRLPNQRMSRELMAHFDFTRDVDWT
jgi:uncharacterized LabA/DUF88 family protein